ncbi:MAG: carotenoid oxygenase family protein [Acidimicrobiales bacterium]
MPTTNPYLEGNFAPVTAEVTETELVVDGSLPGHLDGRYLRIGPNPISANPARYHWFMGTGMVHGLRIRDGAAEWYRNRFVRSPGTSRQLGEPQKKGPVHAGFDMSPNTNVIGHAGRTLALIEAGSLPYELTLDLDTVGACDFDGTLVGGYTAHPLRDPSTGDLHAISYFFGWGDQVQYSVIGTDGRVVKTVDIEVTGSPMMHAFSLTERHVVIYDLPVTFDVKKGAAKAPKPFAKPTELAMSRTIGRRRIPDTVVSAMMATSPKRGDQSLPYSWNPDYPARVGVMPREGGSDDVSWFEVEPCYVYHPLNAYDDGDQIVLDVTRHPKTFATEHRGPNDGVPTLDRWTVDLSAGKVLEERLDDRGQEFPRIDERLVGRKNRFGYMVELEDTRSGDVSASHGVIKHDLLAGGSQIRSFGADHEVDEFVFVPNATDSAEDDGVLMGFVYDRNTDRSDLFVLDAGTLETVATVHLPVRVPHGFHGNWIPAI